MLRSSINLGGIERGANMAARSVRVKVRAGDVERHADQFDGLARENARGPR